MGILRKVIALKVHITITDDSGNTYEGVADLMQIKGKDKSKHSANLKEKIAQKTKSKGPTDAIKNLFLQEFFKEERKFSDVTKRLSDMGFNFSSQSISNALNRAEYLTKKGTKGDHIYVQKYPPS